MKYTAKSNAGIKPYNYSIVEQMNNYHNKIINKQKQAVKEILTLLFCFFIIVIALFLYLKHKESSYIINGGREIEAEQEFSRFNALPIYPLQD